MSNNKLMINLIKSYQKNKTSSGRCKHIPSCSNYGLECFSKFNFIKASMLTTYRIIRCNPLTKNIYDPVPLSKTEKKEYINKINSTLKRDKHLFEELRVVNDLEQVVENIYNSSKVDNFYSRIDTYLYLVKKKIIKKPYKKTYKTIMDLLLNDKYNIK